MYRFTRNLLAGISVAAALLCAPSGQAADCNGNGEDDAAEIAAGRASDCNRNGAPDPCDLAASRPGLEVRSRIELETPAGSMAVGDFDGNGRPDVITGSPGGLLGLDLYLQADSGAFERPSRIPTGTENVTALEAADIDGDGDLDLAGASPSSRKIIYIRNDAGVFGEPTLIEAVFPIGLIAEDLDRDGREDIAFTSIFQGAVVILWNDGSGGFTEHSFPNDSRPVSLAAADFQGDGRPDLLIGHETAMLTVHRNLGDRAFQFEFREVNTGAGNSVLAEDMTGDGAPEVIALGQQLIVFQNGGQGIFERPSIADAGPSARAMTGIDMDADGRLDVAVMNSDAPCNQPFHTLHVLRNLGNGKLAMSEQFQGGPVSTHAFPTIRAADMDGDGKQDVIATAGASSVIPGFLTILSPMLRATSPDCDANGIPDECDPDCNSNGVPDACDIANLSSNDADLDDVPDECQRDCNGNGRPDSLEVARGESPDQDGSGFPDECEFVAPNDCNGNGIPDAAEIASGTAPDCNGNARPDACDLERGFVFDILHGFSAPVREGGPVAVADLDGDGVVDFAVAPRSACCPSTPRSGGIALFRGLGDGNFASLGEQSLGGEPSALEAADIDLDGDQDLVAASVETCRVTNTIAVFRNGGRATFGKPEVFPARGRPNVMTLADMDGDGSADIFVLTAAFNENFARVFGNDGRGTFGEWPQAVSVAVDSWHIAPVDVNGDSLLDIAIARPDPGVVQVFLADAGLRFREPRSIEAPRPGPISAGDLDGDADTDLVAIVTPPDTFAQAALTVLWNDASGGFPAKTTLDPGFHGSWAAVRDLDRDGHEDIVLLGIPQGFVSGHRAGLLGTILGRGSGSFDAPSRFPINGLIERGTASDLDGNGSVDVLATIEDDFGDHAFVFENTGRGAFRTTGRMDLEGGPGSMAAVDLDADGKIDLAVADPDAAGLGVFWNADRGAFSGPEEHALPANVGPMDPGDLDGDGDVDIAAVVPFGVQLFLNSGRRPIEVGQKLVLGSVAVGIAARDLDGDGDTDIVTANTVFQEIEDNVSVFENLGGGRFAAARNFVAGRRPSTMTAADFDGDGDIDLAIRNLDPPNLGFLANNGRGVFSRRTAVPVHANAHFIIALDADGDGDADLAAGPGFRFLLNRGGWDFHWGADPMPGGLNFSMATGDLDGDGAPEIVAGISAEFEIYPNLGGGRLGPPSGAPSYPDGGGGSDTISYTMRGVAVADLDGDGRNDLAGSVHYERSFVTVLLNRSPGYSLDADGDGVPDECGSEPFRRGDSNGDGGVDLSDAIYILRSLFLGGEPLPCLKAADANDDSRVDVSDPVKILGVLFLGEPALPAPSEACGADPTGDALGCADFQGCA